MSLITRLLICLCLLPLTALCQERMTKMMAGQNGDDYRILVTFMGVKDDSYKLQSLIVNVNRVKNKNDLPTDYLVDLTTTTRSLTSGTKKQKILVFRWGKSGEMEVKCEGGKWAKQASGPELDKIVEIVKQVVQNAPRDAKEPVGFTLPSDLEQKVISILDDLETSALPCVRTGS